MPGRRTESGGDLPDALRQTHLLKLLADANVKILSDTNVLEIMDKGVTIADKYGKRGTLEAILWCLP